MLRLVLSVLILGLLFPPEEALAKPKQTLRWLTWVQVPNFILEGQFKGEGLGDHFTKALQQKLPQYQHENIVSNTRRYNRLILEENVCVAWAWIVPGSEAYRIHSKPVSLAPRTGILTLKSKQHLFGQPGETLSLEKLLANPNITLGYLEEMTYSNRVHELIEQYRGKGNIHFSSRSEVELDLKMLDRNRLDYFFAFSAQSIFDAETKAIPNKYQFYNIEEIDRYTSMHSHCSKTPLGREVMEAVNKILTKEFLLEHLSIVERWYGKNQHYQEVFMDYVINQQANELVTNPGQ